MDTILTIIKTTEAATHGTVNFGAVYTFAVITLLILATVLVHELKHRGSKKDADNRRFREWVDEYNRVHPDPREIK
mgnify:CR=1 FL=1